MSAFGEPATHPSETLLEVSGLGVSFEQGSSAVIGVQDATFDIARGQVLGLVGESGCGKSVTSLAIVRLLRCPPARIVSGRIIFDGIDLLKMKPSGMRALRGEKISMIFQNPGAALNPTMTVEQQIGEAILSHRRLRSSDLKSRVLQLLKLVGIPSASQRRRAYPHELSGGMKQRVLIAMAVALEPDLLIADEPTTALDVTIQAQVLSLLNDLRRRMGMAILFITHDLALAASFCDDVVVMYAGLTMERASVSELFAQPLHPYTRALLASRPTASHRQQRVSQIPGQPPVLHSLSQGCPFAPRCPLVTDECKMALPELREIKLGHAVRCIKA